MTGTTEKVILLSNESSTGSEKIAKQGGRYVFAIDGTFNSATCTLQIQSPDGSSWIGLTDGAFTAEGAVTVEVPANTKFRVFISGSPSAMYATLVKVNL